MLLACGTQPVLVAPHLVMGDAGSEPRRVLRYQFHAGQTERYELDSQGTTKTAGAALMTPTLRLTVVIGVDSVEADGSAHVTTVVETARSLDDGNVPAVVRMQFASELAKVVGLRIVSQVSTRGVWSHTTITAPANAGALVNAVIAELRTQVERSVASVPEDSVGVGARWDVEREDALGGTTMATTSHQHVLAIDETGGQIEADLAMTAHDKVIDRDIIVRRVEGGGHARLDWSGATLLATGEASASLNLLIDSHGRVGAVRFEQHTAVRRLP